MEPREVPILNELTIPCVIVILLCALLLAREGYLEDKKKNKNDGRNG